MTASCFMVGPVKPLRGTILASALVALGALAVVAYAVSCSSPPSPEPVPALGRFTPSLPEPTTPSPLAASADEARPSVGDVLDDGCSTAVVQGLSEQIIAEANCLEPGAYEPVPELDNVTLDRAVFPYLQRDARDALVSAANKAKARKLKITSMLRTVAQQYLLYDWYDKGRCGIKLAAEPGQSNHQSGLAIDITDPGGWRRALGRAGFRWMGDKDRWHFDFHAKDKPSPGLDIQAFQRLHNENRPERRVADDGVWSEETEEALRAAPAAGFDAKPDCSGDAE